MLIKTIEKKGTSNFVLIPKVFLDCLGLSTKDKVEVRMENDKIIISPIKKESEIN
jgi:antitoxin component of MazEF toxin-antitoxin module